ncbi:TPA: hypothetical protein U1C03_001883 [Streptococcus suis]|nr:hypothetical protein [Streptococcus suis]
MIEKRFLMKTEQDYDLTKGWYRKSLFIEECYKGMKIGTLNNYIRQMRGSSFSFGVKGTHGNVYIHSEVFRDWFDSKINKQYTV